MTKKIIIMMFAALISISTLIAQEDHKENIEGPFESPLEVTETCLECHEEVGDDILKTRHWNWLGDEFDMPKHGKKRFGKQNVINNFCVAVPSNYPRCTSCHIGYGWKDDSFDFSDALNIDCLVCHETTGTYKKVPTAAGMPVKDIDLLKIAQSVKKPTRQNCVTCHFYGGGGNGVKHGDMDNSLINPSRDLDVHMGGNDFACTECHTTENHKIGGASHGSMAQGIKHISCLDCHDSEPHEKEKLNNHTGAVSCEACHIPALGRGNPTKVWWDWSTAGQDTHFQKDEFGKETYNKKKGNFIWAKNFKPEYRWYNGKADYYQFGDKINPKKIVKLNKLNGSVKDAGAKIFPFKLMKGKQIFDKKNNYLIVPNLFGKDGYWKKWDWNLASEVGMESVGLDYSGEYDFVETEMYIPANHMVAPKEKALKCWDCHHKTKGRLDWKALGYPGDPMKNKGRKATGLLK